MAKPQEFGELARGVRGNNGRAAAGAGVFEAFEQVAVPIAALREGSVNFRDDFDKNILQAGINMLDAGREGGEGLAVFEVVFGAQLCRYWAWCVALPRAAAGKRLAVRLAIQKKLPQMPCLSHDMDDKNRVAFAPVENAARPHIQSAVNRIGQLGGDIPGIWKPLKTLDS